jgi:hypothetical protein
MEIARVSKPLRLKPKVCDVFLYLCTLTNGTMFWLWREFSPRAFVANQWYYVWLWREFSPRTLAPEAKYIWQRGPPSSVGLRRRTFTPRPPARRSKSTSYAPTFERTAGGPTRCGAAQVDRPPSLVQAGCWCGSAPCCTLRQRAGSSRTTVASYEAAYLRRVTIFPTVPCSASPFVLILDENLRTTKGRRHHRYCARHVRLYQRGSVGTGPRERGQGSSLEERGTLY